MPSETLKLQEFVTRISLFCFHNIKCGLLNNLLQHNLSHWTTLDWTFNIVLKVFNYQFLIFILHLQPGRYAVPRVQEGPPLALLGQVVDEDADEVDSDEDDDVGGDRLPLGHQVEVGVEEDDGDDGVETGEQEAVGHSQPSPGNIFTEIRRD